MGKYAYCSSQQYDTVPSSTDRGEEDQPVRSLQSRFLDGEVVDGFSSLK